MNRDEARQIWARIAKGDLEREDPEDPIDLHSWISQIASKLLEADQLPAGQRPGAVVRATGLTGLRDAHPELRELLMDVRWDFPVHDGCRERYFTQRERIRLILEEAQRQGLLNGIYASDEKAARELIHGMIAKKR